MKVRQCPELEAEVVCKGANYDESLVYCKILVSKSGATYIPSFDDFTVIAGHGTIGYEILEEMPETDTILVPVGGGGLISGIALWAKTVNPEIRVAGVQSTAAYTMSKCFSAKKLIHVPIQPTIADGLAGGISQRTLDLTLKYVDEVLLAKEDHLQNAIIWILKNEHQIIEGSSAVGPAILMDKGIRLRQGEKVAIVISGGNLSMELLSLPE
jgi:threonine dehydratase